MTTKTNSTPTYHEQVGMNELLRLVIFGLMSSQKKRLNLMIAPAPVFLCGGIPYVVEHKKLRGRDFEEVIWEIRELAEEASNDLRFFALYEVCVDLSPDEKYKEGNLLCPRWSIRYARVRMEKLPEEDESESSSTIELAASEEEA